MSDKDIIKQLAEQVMGWREWSGDDGWPEPGCYRLYDGWAEVWKSVDVTDYRMWRPLEDMNDAFEMQRAIETAGKEWAFGLAIASILERDYLPIPKGRKVSAAWAVLNATARQRCEAAVRMLGGEA